MIDDYSLKAKQAHMEMAHKGIQEERAKEQEEEIIEERFLKDLYLFMKKRDTPIERIPHLGFKQIDLFVMFKTVRDLGGYHQVTAQQLWKQVYNTLGGNPRSTSAATCTRRHYEKLLLPYECHVKGILINALSHQPKPFHFSSFNKDDDDDGQRPAKRKLISMPPHQIPYNQPAPNGNVFPFPLQYSHFYHPSHAVLSPYVPISPQVLTSHSPPAAKPQFTVHPSFTTPPDGEKGPLEHLRGLADKYKHLTGLTEPLNLSKKASSQETNKYPASSFSQPKFLNKPPRLYTAHQPQVPRNGETSPCSTQESETREDEAAVEVTPYLYSEEEKDAYIVGVRSASSSPTYASGQTLRTDELKPSSPKTDASLCPLEDREGSSELRRLSLSSLVPSIPRDSGNKMEIEIPLSVLHKWLKLCQSESSVTTPGAVLATALPMSKEHTEQKNFPDTDVLSISIPSHMNPQQQSSAAEDLRLRPRHVPSPTTPIQTTSNHHSINHNNLSSYKPLTSGDIRKNALSHDGYPFERDTYSKHLGVWSAHDKETWALKPGSGPLTGYQVNKPFTENTHMGGRERSETKPSAVLMLDSSPGSVLHLTTEEVMKLKKIISSSL